MACAGVASVAADAQRMRFTWVSGVRPGSASDVAKVGAESLSGEHWIEHGAMRGTEVTPPPNLITTPAGRFVLTEAQRRKCDKNKHPLNELRYIWVRTWG